MRYLTDSDFLVGLFRIGDLHHKTSRELLEKTKKVGYELYVLNIVLYEAATVLSNRTGMKAVKLFYEKYPKLKMQIITLDEQLEDGAWKIFLKQTKKGTSFIDCANLAVIEKYKLDGILSFDKFYPDKLRVK